MGSGQSAGLAGQTTASASSRMPTWFLTHGGGPMPLLHPDSPSHAKLVANLRTLASTLSAKPKAILIISGHHEENIPTVVTAEQPPMLYDYYNFPPEAYKIQYTAPGSPELANRTLDLLRAAGIKAKSDSKRGYDHGVFVPLSLVFPEADIPVVQLSMISSLDPKVHIEIGKAIAPLRDEGVLVIGSGSSFHSIPAIQKSMRGTNPLIPESIEFDNWLQDTLAKGNLSPKEREDRFARWYEAPSGRFCHPSEDHLIPAHVCLGSANGERAQVLYSGPAMGAAMSSYSWA